MNIRLVESHYNGCREFTFEEAQIPEPRMRQRDFTPFALAYVVLAMMLLCMSVAALSFLALMP